MPRLPKIPDYRLHKRSGLAVVTLPDGFGRRRDVQLGKYDSPESRAEYDRVIAEWLANGRRFVKPGPASEPSPLSRQSAGRRCSRPIPRRRQVGAAVGLDGGGFAASQPETFGVHAREHRQ